MKQVRLFVSSFIMLALATVGQAETKITKNETESYEIKACEIGMREGRPVTFQIGENGIAEAVLIKDGCATKTYSKGVVKPGQVVVIKFDDKEIRKVILDDQAKLPPRKGIKTFVGGIEFSVIESGPELIEITGCSLTFKPFEQVSIGNRRSIGATNPVAKIATVAKDDRGELCFVVNFKKGEIQDGDEIGIGYSAPKAVVVALNGIPWRRSDDHTGQPINGGPMNPPVAVDNRLTENNQNVAMKARAAARGFADQVVNNLGEIESVRFNLFTGFRSAERLSAVLSPRVEDTREYALGLQAGTENGRLDGSSAGLEDARKAASSLASADLSLAIDSAMNGGTFSPRARQVVNGDSVGVAPTLPPIKTIEERLKTTDLEIQAKLRQMTRFESGVVISDDAVNEYYRIYDIYSMKEYRSDFILSSYRAEKALEGWSRNVFGSSVTLQGYYRDVINPAIYKDAAENRRVFELEFLNEYELVIASRWNKAVTRPRPEVQEIGAQLYVNLSRQYAKDLGIAAGYKLAYQRSNAEAYNTNVNSLYQSYFQSNLAIIQSKANLSNVTMAASASNGEKYLTVGDSIEFFIASASNRSAVSATIEGAVQTSDYVYSNDPTIKTNVPAFTNLTSAVDLGSRAFLARIAGPDDVIRVQVSTNVGIFYLSVRTNFETLIHRLASTNNSSLKSIMLTYLKQYLAAEFEHEKTNFGNGFSSDNKALLINRMVNAVATMNSSEQQNILQLRKEIRSAYGKRPGWSLIGGYRDDYDEAMNILERAGL